MSSFFETGNMMKSFVYGTLSFFGLMVCISFAAPEPAIIPGPRDWTLDVTFEHPQQIVARTEKGESLRFWYTIVTLTNESGRDVDFFPNCELMTDTFHILPAGKSTPTGVFEGIKRRHQRKYPFMEALDKAGNRMLEGEDNAKDIAVIWPDFDEKVKNIKVFVSGLSNETASIDHPVEKDGEGKAVKVYLRKTLELSYSVSGDPALRSYAKLSYKGKRWIMR
ncbi:MAG: hypothetical protein GWN67_05155 [Phycisphaerae bacterium]|nr:hypothetical protein [Phycisphaerae bacterium]NIU08293.1 hypothetical protein [Phycisphaerae bacterium]NIU55789.1 hypothetical protein [Phycisphaerae bacterium]NIU99927.1 hypothetical protein [Phycisphaerae bacterium]NIV68844.1 hypothetical protein [Phycisphaerae bacterium]